MKNILPEGVECIFVRQPEQLGLGHAILCAERAIGAEPFAVLLADDFLIGEASGTTADLISAFIATGKTQLSSMEVAGPDICNYGVIIPGDSPRAVSGLGEKPKAEDAPSNLASIGRYVLNHSIFETLRGLEAGAGGEIKLAAPSTLRRDVAQLRLCPSRASVSIVEVSQATSTQFLRSPAGVSPQS